MRILVEEHQYQATDEILEVVKDLGPTIGVKGKVSISYVGYYYNKAIEDCVFILPKVLLKEEKILDIDGKQIIIDVIAGISRKEDDSFVRPEDIITPEGQDKYLNPGYRNFVYNLAVWIYRAICVFKESKDSKIVLEEHISQIGNGQRRLSNTYLDILLSLEDFNKNNQDFFFFIIKNLHSGHNKINWTRTISHSQAYVQNGAPIYLNPVNKRRQVNFDEELMVIFFSILNHIHKKYGFPFDTDCNYELINDHQFESYVKGMGKARLMEIKYKYFSDKALELWDLCYAFFDQSKQIVVDTKQKDYLLVKSFEIVFEDIIDDLLSNKQDVPKGLVEQLDGKRVDHMYRYRALTESSSENVYYIGDSKYYKRDTPIGKEALYKQFTYARNVIQWNLDLFLDDNRKLEQEEEIKKGTGMLRDDETEGYNILPNFFISAQQKDLEMHSEITWVDKNKAEFSSRQFNNRVFDRDTLLVAHYDVNFLYVISLYGKKNEGEKAIWRDAVRKQFREEIQKMLNMHFQFHVMTPRKHVDGKDILKQNFKQIIGKVFQPYPKSESGQRYYSLALEKPETISDSNIRRKVEEENKRIIDLLDPYFDMAKCELGEDKRNELIQYTPDGQYYTKDEMVLLITKEGVYFEQAIGKLESTSAVGVDLQMNAAFRLAEGFTKAKYLIIHDKKEKQFAYKIVGNGPLLRSGVIDGEMVVTKEGAGLYLVYDVDVRDRIPLGEIDLSTILKGRQDYYFIPLSKLRMKSYG